MKGYTAIAGWVKDVPLPALADLYMRAGASPARPPSKATIFLRPVCRTAILSAFSIASAPEFAKSTLEMPPCA